MQKLLGLLVGAAALAVTSLPANAVVIGDFGQNPTSSDGFFSNNPTPDAPATFYDQYTFQLLGAAFVTVTSATNTFATGVGSSFYIANFTGAIYQIVGGIDAAPGGDDILKFGPQAATLCASALCQTLDGVGILPGGSYYLAIAGQAGSLAGYGGNLSVTETPIPGAAFLFGSVIAGLGGVRLYRRRKTA